MPVPQPKNKPRSDAGYKVGVGGSNPSRRGGAAVAL